MTPHRSDSFLDLADGWISTGTRFMGFVGLGYEMFVDKLKNPTALIVFGALATAKDVLQYRRILKNGAEQQSDTGEERPAPTQRSRR